MPPTALSGSLETRSFKAGSTIFNQDDDLSNAMYIVASGDVNIFLPGEASNRISLKDIARGEYFRANWPSSTKNFAQRQRVGHHRHGAAGAGPRSRLVSLS